MKLSEQLIEIVEHEARGAIDTLRHVTPLGHIESTLTAAAESITRLESENAALTKRVAEQAALIECAAAEFREALTHTRDLQSQLAAKTKRVAELEETHLSTGGTVSKKTKPKIPDLGGELLASLKVPRLEEENAALTKHIADLQSQLAWTPVSAGLPTERADYEFTHCDSEQVSRLDLVRLTHEGFELVLSGETFVEEELLDNVDYTHFRKVELP